MAEYSRSDAIFAGETLAGWKHLEEQVDLPTQEIGG